MLNDQKIEKFRQIVENKFQIYPNPSGDVFNVFYQSPPTNTPIRLSVKNISGQIIFSKEYQNFTGEIKDTIDLNSKAKGIYFVEMINGEMVETKKIVLE